ncbi:transglutaminase domain-containing protein [Streptococcus iniae]
MVNSYAYATEELASNHETASKISVHAPEALYKDKRGVCQAYAVMFRDMATAAGLDAWYVTGKSNIIGDPCKWESRLEHCKD